MQMNCIDNVSLNRLYKLYEESGANKNLEEVVIGEHSVNFRNMNIFLTCDPENFD